MCTYSWSKWNSSTNDYEKINPKENLYEIRASDYYGDQWSDELETEDKIILKKYFSQFDHLKKKFGFISFFIGNKEFNIKFGCFNDACCGSNMKFDSSKKKCVLNSDNFESVENSSTNTNSATNSASNTTNSTTNSATK